jgi:hypothetical protein
MQHAFRQLGRVALAVVMLVVAASTSLEQSRAGHMGTRLELALAARVWEDVEHDAFVPKVFDVKAVEGDVEEPDLRDQDAPSDAATLGVQALLLSRKAERARSVVRLGFAPSRVSAGAPLPRGPPA